MTPPRRRTAADDALRVHPETRQEWRQWLTEHHSSERAVWLVSWRRPTGRAAVGYDAAVSEALAFGWVDSVQRRLDEQRTMLYFARRSPGSGWSRPNKLRIAALQRDGLMTPAGQRVVDAAIADGSWAMLDDVENLLVPPDLASALDAVPGARDHWDRFPPSARRGILEWIVQARRPDTRARRIVTTAEHAGRGERANQWTPRDQRGR